MQIEYVARWKITCMGAVLKLVLLCNHVAAPEEMQYKAAEPMDPSQAPSDAAVSLSRVPIPLYSSG